MKHSNCADGVFLFDSSRGACWLVLLLVASAAVHPSRSQAGESRKATNSRAARREAINALPLERLAPATRELVEHVAGRATVYRRLPTEVIDCDHDLYHFLLNNPELVVNLWKKMGISKVVLTPTGPNSYRADDGEGTVCDIHVLYRSHNKFMILASGRYDGPLLTKPIEAKCLVLLRSNSLRETDGRNYVTCVMDTFLYVERGGLQLLAKTFQSLIGRSADLNFSETMAFVSNMSRTAEVNPRGTERIARRLEQVDEATAERFIMLTNALASRSAQSASVRTAAPTRADGSFRRPPRPVIISSDQPRR